MTDSPSSRPFSVAALTRETAQALMAVAEVFQSRHWEYGGGQGFYVPDIEALARNVDELTAGAYRDADESPDGVGWCSSGRLVVMVNENEIGARLYLDLGVVT